jgi:hypothetical protein
VSRFEGVRAQTISQQQVSQHSLVVIHSMGSFTSLLLVRMQLKNMPKKQVLDDQGKATFWTFLCLGFSLGWGSGGRTGPVRDVPGEHM